MSFGCHTCIHVHVYMHARIHTYVETCSSSGSANEYKRSGPTITSETMDQHMI